MVERRTVVELTISAVAILMFIAGSYVVSSTYAAPRNSSFNGSVPPSVVPEGGLALVAVIGVFIVVVALAGLFVYSQDFDDEE
ncbi:MAG: hypothetical protein V5A44_03770 [Haloarculaceae archaeon]